ncbi:sigma-54-dependent transcriptional regulator [Planctomycetota bacterium]
MLDQANILVIDDEEVIRDSCQQALTREGYGVKVAEDGAQGLALIQNHSFDLIILDLKMPGTSGMELLTRIREIKPETAVVIITGYATIRSAVDTMKSGAYDFLSKPFTPDHLRNIVNEALTKRQTKKGKATSQSCLIDGEGFFF